MRVLILAHGHPTLSAGGAERAAYSLFEHLKLLPDVIPFFAARVPHHLVGHDADFGLFRKRKDEILLALPDLDSFTYLTQNYDKLKERLTALIERIQPDIVHVHHFVYFGVELFEILKSLNVAVVFTLHEYIPICHNYGQMVTVGGRLCYASSPVECAQCFSEVAPGRFFLREQMIKVFLSYADAFVAPSTFLAERYVAWGINRDAIQVIENPLPPSFLQHASDTAPPSDYVDAGRNGDILRIGYFGQLNPFKGPQVILEAVKLLPSAVRSNVMLGIHGANLEIQEGAFQDKMRVLFDELSGTVFNFGPYENTQVINLMRGYDWIVIPSVWWENSPVVIQEARLAGTPLLYARLGGIAEKASAAKIAVSFEVGSAASAARRIEELVRAANRPRLDPRDVISDHLSAVQTILALYRSVMPSTVHQQTLMVSSEA